MRLLRKFDLQRQSCLRTCQGAGFAFLGGMEASMARGEFARTLNGPAWSDAVTIDQHQGCSGF